MKHPFMTVKRAILATAAFTVAIFVVASILAVEDNPGYLILARVQAYETLCGGKLPYEKQADAFAAAMQSKWLPRDVLRIDDSRIDRAAAAIIRWHRSDPAKFCAKVSEESERHMWRIVRSYTEEAGY